MKTKTFCGILTYKDTGKKIFIKDNFLCKTDFIKCYRGNGYGFTNFRIKEEEVYNWLCDNGSDTKLLWDDEWKYINTIDDIKKCIEIGKDKFIDIKREKSLKTRLGNIKKRAKKRQEIIDNMSDREYFLYTFGVKK